MEENINIPKETVTKPGLFTKRVRWINLIGLNASIFSMIPYYLDIKLGVDMSFIPGKGDLLYAGIYLLIFFSLWVFILFLILEIKYVIKNKINVIKHFLCTKMVLFGIVPLFIYLIMKL